MRNLTRTTALASGLLLATGAMAQTTDLGAHGFSISLGDEVIAGATPPYREGLAPADAALQRLDMQVQFDTLRQERMLNVLTEDMREAYAAGEEVRFRASMNYPAFVDRAEVLILDRTRPGRRVVDVVPVAPNGTGGWVMPAGGPADLAYVLRVYDARGRFDETHPVILRRTADPSDAPALNAAYRQPGEGEDRTARRNIPVRGGTVIVSGQNAVPGDTITVAGDEVMVDGSGRFVVTRILPVGDNIVEVEAYGRRILRDVHVPQSDWFRTGLIDITAGYADGELYGDREHYLDGRAAFYVSGITASGWRVTASADTEYGPLEDMFSRLDDRDTLRVLDRLREDGNDLYPTYGDDSTWYDDTPTSGNLYLRVQNETTRLTWGDFTSSVEGAGLMRSSRDLYGVELRHRSAGTMVDGNPRLQASVYAATPDSLPQRDILRGTGGSLYFLSRRELVGGSTRVTIEETDPDTGFVVATRTLAEGADYQVDHLQGVLILNEPLASGTSDGTVISGPAAERVLNLVVQYEYLPAGDVGEASFGGRVEGWVNDDIRLGATGLSDETGSGRQTSIGADIRLEFGEASFLTAEVAQSDGPGFGRSTSTDGGLSLVNTAPGVATTAMAYEARIGLDFGDLGLDMDGRFEAYAQVREAGFETITEDTPNDQQLYGLSLDVSVTERLRFGADLEHFNEDNGEEFTEGEIRFDYAIDEMWTVTGALAMLDRDDPADAERTGTRTDAALRLTYTVSEDLTVYGFVQGTLDVSGGLDRNDRAGLGVDAAIGDRLRVTAEASGGSGGLAAEARATWRPTENNEIYLGYSLDPTRASSSDPFSDRGRIVAGASYHYSDTVTTFAESVYDLPGDQRSLTQAYGVTWTPGPVWAFSAGLETGAIEDAVSGDFDRLGLSLGAVWSPDEDRTGRLRLEYRTEDGEGVTRDRDTWALAAGYSTRVARDWRLVADLDAQWSDSGEDPLEDAEYLHASLGYAYRPVTNERLNLLFRASVIHDLPARDQRGADGTTDGPQQRSAILSVAGTYDLMPELTASGKLGYRMSEVAARGSDVFTSETATLTALRFDWHVTPVWDLMAEGRFLYTEETGTRDTGLVLGIYRHVNDHVSIGLGYEWGNVSDDLANIDYDGRGVFVNLVGRF
jgi:hypothetical protein